jgi:prepilin-type N-terminal cleavage/methylation domain-containing protein
MSRGLVRGRARRGFTLIEVVAVLAFVGILTGIAVPNMLAARRRAQATQVLSDLQLLQLAWTQYCADNDCTSAQLLPPAASVGVVPLELKPYLPTGYSFNKQSTSGYQLQWTRWPGSSAEDSRSVRRAFRRNPNAILASEIAILVQTNGSDDSDLGALVSVMGDSVPYVETIGRRTNTWMFYLDYMPIRSR